MPDWFVKRNGEDSPYPYHVRLGGCEYSLTEEQWTELTNAFYQVDLGSTNYVESEDYADLVIADTSKAEQGKSLLSLLGIEKPTMGRRGM